MLRPIPLSILLGVSTTVAITCEISRLRTRRTLAAVNAALAGVSPGERPVALHELSSSEADRLLATTQNIINTCQRMRWFAADLSHELRTPLTALRTELEESRLHPDQVDVPRLIRNGLTSVDRVETVLANMIALARLGTGEPDREQFDLTELVREVISSTVRRQSVRLRPSGPVMVTGVREQIRQALTNLLDNAQRHAYSRVEIEVSRTTPEVARLVIDDDGDGIPDADRERIFLRFTRLNGNRRGDAGGAGLGLNITRMIAEAHGGTVQVEDPPPHVGARFVLRLPTGGTVDAESEDGSL